MIAETTNSFTPLLTSVGFGGIAGFLIGLAIRYIIKILAIVAGIFFAALAYLQSQGILNINWEKLQTLSQPLLSSLTNNLNSTGTGTGTGHGATTTAAVIPSILHSNLSFLPVDMGLPLAGSAGLGFVFGLTRGL
jgi:uncharacterized membrane protein (Fun14 family)